MYHVGNDKRKIESAHLLLDSLFQLSKQKPFAMITISDLHRISGISRSTFYRLFDQPLDILAYQCDIIMEDIIQLQESNGDYFTFLTIMAHRWYENAKLLELIVWSQSIDLLYHSFAKYESEILTFIKIDSQDEVLASYIFYILVSSLLGTLQAWMKHDKKEKPEELLSIMARTFKLFEPYKKTNEEIGL